MRYTSIKILEMRIQNLKNVVDGYIGFAENANITGIYGQNGSGKTTLIEALNIIKKLMGGESINNSEISDMMTNDKIASIEISFLIDKKYILDYKVSFEKNKNKFNYKFSKDTDYNIVRVIKESLTTKRVNKGEQPRVIVSYSLNENDDIELLPKYRFRMTQKNATVFYITKETIENNNSSYIFSKLIGDFILDSKDLEKEYKDIYKFTKKDIPENIFIYSNQMSGLINAKLNLPMQFFYQNSKEKAYGFLSLPISSSGTLSKIELEMSKNIIQQINIVLPMIIPKMQLEIKEIGVELDDKGKEIIRIEVLSIRDDIKIPFRSESDGIKKIVSILSSLINLYGSRSAIVAIDELDSGIFEFLLGEILSVLSTGAKGQLIFTSHNLRPLEVLEDENIIFTSINPNDRYRRIKGIRETNNLRDIYLRNIQIDKSANSLYEQTNSFGIQKSFRKAFRSGIDSDLIEIPSKEEYSNE